VPLKSTCVPTMPANLSVKSYELDGRDCYTTCGGGRRLVFVALLCSMMMLTLLKATGQSGMPHPTRQLASSTLVLGNSSGHGNSSWEPTLVSTQLTSEHSNYFAARSSNVTEEKNGDPPVYTMLVCNYARFDVRWSFNPTDVSLPPLHGPLLSYRQCHRFPEGLLVRTWGAGAGEVRCYYLRADTNNIQRCTSIQYRRNAVNIAVYQCAPCTGPHFF